MKIFKSILFLIFLTFGIYSHAEEKLIVGMTMYLQSDLDKDRIKKLSITMLDNMNEYYNNNLGMHIYDNQEDLLKDFKEKKNINAFVLYPEFYYENKDLIKQISKNPFIYKHSSVNNSQLLLITNKKSGIKTIDDLKGKVFMNTSFMKNYLIWLDYLTLKNLKKSYKDVIKNELITDKSSRSLLNVYFNKADFVIIEKDIYDDMLILNPSLEKNLTIIAKSPEVFFTAITAIQKDASPRLTNLVNEILDSKNFIDNFREFLKLVNLDSTSKIDYEDLKEMEDFYSEYRILKKKYN